MEVGFPLAKQTFKKNPKAMALVKGEHFVSPNIKKSSLNLPLAFADKVNIFEDRVLGWQLLIGMNCYHQVRDGGFGALYITLSYFELIARYREGSVDHKKAGKKFRKGFSDFAKFVGFSANPDFSTVRDLLYEGARCGLYHVGTTSKKVFIGGKRSGMFEYDSKQKRLVIDPEQLIGAMIKHFETYIAELRSGAAKACQPFEKKFDHDILPQLT